jgi:hypothetical protein
VDAGRTSQGIRRRHFLDQGGDLGADARAASAVPTRELGPIRAEAAALSSQDGVGRHDDQGLPPTSPESGEAGPEQAVSRVELRAGQRSLVNSKLLAKGEVLKGELTVTADEEGKEPEQVE